MRAAGYIRLSKDEEDTTSYRTQRQAIESLCKARGWTLAEIFQDEGHSAYAENGKRPAYEAMMSRLSEFGAVVFLRLDRLTRGNPAAVYTMAQRFKEAGTAMVGVDGEVDTSTAQGEMFYTISGAFAHLYSRQLSESMKRMHADRKENHTWAGQVPYGWRKATEGDADDARTDEGLVPIPKQQAVLRDVATRYVGGESLRSIAKTTRFTHANLARMLRTDRVLEALPPDLAGKLVVEMGERGRTGTSATPTLLGGIARCSQCDGPMTVVATRKRNGEAWGAYACRERHVYISKPACDRIVTEAVFEAIDVKQLTKRLSRRKQQPAKAMQPAAVEARIEQLDHDAHALPDFPRERYLRTRTELVEQLAQARAAMTDDAGPDISLELARRLPEAWDTMTVPSRRQVVRAVVRTVRVERATGNGPVDPKRVEITLR